MRFAHEPRPDSGVDYPTPAPREREGVTLARPDVHYVVTEFEIAYLFGKSVRERAMALIEIAHPDFCERLLAEAKQQSFVPTAHKLVSCSRYLVEEECVVALKCGRKAMLRPARGNDASSMQTMFHRMCDCSARKGSSEPTRIASGAALTRAAASSARC